MKCRTIFGGRKCYRREDPADIRPLGHPVWHRCDLTTPHTHHVCRRCGQEEKV